MFKEEGSTLMYAYKIKKRYLLYIYKFIGDHVLCIKIYYLNYITKVSF